MKPSVSFIGAGNVATHLAPALARMGYNIKGICSRTMKSADELAQKVLEAGERLPLTTNVIEQIPEAEVYIISVKDDALAGIAAAWPEKLRGGVVLHTAGSLPMKVIAETSPHYGVLYPLQTFTKDSTLNLKEITCFIEGCDEHSLSAAQQIAGDLFGHSRIMSSDERKVLHVAAVFACNFTNHMYALAYELLNAHKVDPQCLRPLIEATAHKLESTMPHDGQTGPARRGDETIVGKHLEMLSGNAELTEIYRLLSDSIMRRYKHNEEE